MLQADTLIENAHVVTVDPERRVFTNGFLAFRAGMVAAVGPMSACDVVATETIDGAGKVVLPGIANAHNHLNQICFRGYNDDRWPILDIQEAVRSLLHQLSVVVARLDEERSYFLSRLHALDMIKAGYTATHDEHFTHVDKKAVDGSWAAIAESGMRGFLARCIVSSAGVPEAGRETAEAGLAEAERLRAKFNSDRIEVVPGFLNYHFVADPEDMRRIKRGAEQMGAHFDIDMTDNSLGAGLKARGFDGGQVEYYRAFDILTEPIYAGKAVGIRPNEFKILAEHGCRVSMVPMLRFFDAVGLPVHHLLKEGVLPAIGTDAPMVADCQSPFEVMRQTILGQNLAVRREIAAGGAAPAPELWANAERVVEMATLGGARTLFMDGVTGSLEVGKAADCVVVDARHASMQPTHAGRRLLANVVWSGQTQIVDTVFVAGRKLLAGGRSTVWDEEAVIRSAEQVVTDIARETELDTLLPSRLPGSRYRGWAYQ